MALEIFCQHRTIRGWKFQNATFPTVFIRSERMRVDRHVQGQKYQHACYIHPRSVFQLRIAKVHQMTLTCSRQTHRWTDNWASPHHTMISASSILAELTKLWHFEIFVSTGPYGLEISKRYSRFDTFISFDQFQPNYIVSMLLIRGCRLLLFGPSAKF